MQWLIDILFGRCLDFFQYFRDLAAYEPEAGQMIIGDGARWWHQPYVDWENAVEDLLTTGHGTFQNGIDVDADIDLDGNDLNNVNQAYITQLTLHAAAGNSYLFAARGGNKTISNTDDGQNNIWEHYTSKGDGTQFLGSVWNLQGHPVPHTNLEIFQFVFQPHPTNHARLHTKATGTGTVHPLSIGAGTNAEHHDYQTDGDTEMKEGPLDFTWAMANSTKDPTTDAPADWIEVKINGTVRYVPVYSA